MVITERMCEKVPSILLAWGEDMWFLQETAAESERQSLPQGHSDSFPESDVVSPTDSNFWQ